MSTGDEIRLVSGTLADTAMDVGIGVAADTGVDAGVDPDRDVRAVSSTDALHIALTALHADWWAYTTWPEFSADECKAYHTACIDLAILCEVYAPDAEHGRTLSQLALDIQTLAKNWRAGVSYATPGAHVAKGRNPLISIVYAPEYFSRLYSLADELEAVMKTHSATSS